MGFPTPTTDVREIERELASAQERIVARPTSGNPVVVLRMEDPRTYYVASSLLSLDREVRRSVRAIEAGSASLSSAVVAQFDTEGGYEARLGIRATYPVPPSQASLGVAGAREGLVRGSARPFGFGGQRPHLAAGVGIPKHSWPLHMRQVGHGVAFYRQLASIKEKRQDGQHG